MNTEKIELKYMNLVNDFAYFLAKDINSEIGESYRTVGLLLNRLLSEIRAENLEEKKIVNCDGSKAFTDIDKLLDSV